MEHLCGGPPSPASIFQGRLSLCVAIGADHVLTIVLPVMKTHSECFSSSQLAMVQETGAFCLINPLPKKKKKTIGIEKSCISSAPPPKTRGSVMHGRLVV